MSWVICCDNDACGKVSEVMPGLGGAPMLPANWDSYNQFHYCSDACRIAHQKERQAKKGDLEWHSGEPSISSDHTESTATIAHYSRGGQSGRRKPGMDGSGL